MTRTTTEQLRCRGCGRTPKETRTPVADDSRAFTCSRCLMARETSADAQPGALVQAAEVLR